MLLAYDANPSIFILGFCISLCASFLWIYRRRKKNNLNRTKAQGSYTTTQIFGILGIIFFMFPMFWTIITQLVKGIFVLLILLCGFLHFPDTLESIVIFLYQMASIFFTIIGSYLVCEFMWPKKHSVT